jgi:predicted nucleic acid-binding protein
VSVFVDTSALYALLDEADAHHAEASDVLRRLVGSELVSHTMPASR